MEWNTSTWTPPSSAPPPPRLFDAPSATTLYLYCLGWGLLTGVVVGTFIGGALGALGGVRLALLGLLYGALYGGLVASLPSLLGALAVTVVLRRRRLSADREDVKRDLGWLFVAVVAALDAIVLIYLALLGGDLAYFAGVLLPMGVVNASVAVALYPARTSIARLWS